MNRPLSGHPHLKQRRTNAGFTFLEVLVALAVFAIVLTTIWNLHSQTLSLAPRIRFHSLAPFLAQQKITDLPFQVNPATVGNQGDFGPEYPDLSWEWVVETVDSPAWGKQQFSLIRLDLTIRDPRYHLSYSVRTYRLHPLGQTGSSIPVSKPGR